MGSCSPWGLHGSSPGGLRVYCSSLPCSRRACLTALVATFIPSGVPSLIVAVIAVLVGLHFGRIRGLRQLGESDFRVRLRNAGGISRSL